MKDNYDLKNLKTDKKINSKRKGNKFENDLAKMLNKRFDTKDFSRTPGSGAYATTHNLPKYLTIYGDLITPQDFKFIFEIKRGYNNFNLYDLYNDSSIIFNFLGHLEKDCKAAEKPGILVIKQDRRDILAVLKTNDIMDYMDAELSNIITFGESGMYSMVLWEDLMKIPNTFFFKY